MVNNAITVSTKSGLRFQRISFLDSIYGISSLLFREPKRRPVKFARFMQVGLECVINNSPHVLNLITHQGGIPSMVLDNISKFPGGKVENQR